MRSRIVVAIPVMVIGWLGACSRPASENSPSSPDSQTQGARDIRLAAPAGSDTAVVSALEAGQASKVTRTHQAGRTAEARPTLQPRNGATDGEALEARISQAAALVSEPVPTLSNPQIALEDGSEIPAPVPMAATASEPDRPPINYRPPVLPREPTIIIRGGMGGRDPCELHGRGWQGPGWQGPGMAINRRAPSFGGGSSGGFGRGGIR